MKKIITLFLLITSLAFAKSSIEIHGTSTLHDWAMVSDKITTVLENDGSEITKLNVSVKIETLKSGDEGLDEKAYETLMIDKRNFITYELLGADLENGLIKGVFRVLDKKRTVDLKPDILTLDKIKGSFKVKMTDFGLEVPSVMFGAIKSGDEVTIKYNIEK